MSGRVFVLPECVCVWGRGGVYFDNKQSESNRDVFWGREMWGYLEVPLSSSLCLFQEEGE